MKIGTNEAQVNHLLVRLRFRVGGNGVTTEERVFVGTVWKPPARSWLELLKRIYTERNGQ